MKNNYKDLIAFLEEHKGLPKDMHWWQVADKFGIKGYNVERASFNENYRREYLRKKVSRIWQRYLDEKNLVLSKKVVNKNGETLYEQYRRESPYNVNIQELSGFDIKKITTVPYTDKTYITYEKEEKLNKEDLLNSIREVINKNVIPVENKPVLATNNLALVVYTSDKHIGAYTTENSLYKNKWDVFEMKKRIVDAVINTINELTTKYGSFKELIYFDLGDAIDGLNGKTARGLKGSSLHTLPQSMSNKEMFQTFFSLHKELFININSINKFKNIQYIANGNSNHGGDFEYVTMKTFEIWLNAYFPNIKTTVSDKFIDYKIIGDHCIIYSHGKDMEDRLKGFPINLDIKTETYLNEFIDIHNLHKYHITVVSGDMHTYSLNQTRKIRYLKVPSVYGYSSWLANNFHGTLPGFIVEIIDLGKRDIFHKLVPYEIKRI